MRQFAAREIGARIAEARRLQGMTQEQLADALNVSTRSVQDYEAGTTIPYKHLQMLSRVFDRDIDWFLYGEPAAEATQTGDRDVEIAELREAIEGVRRENREAQEQTLALLEQVRSLLERRRSA